MIIKDPASLKTGIAIKVLKSFALKTDFNLSTNDNKDKSKDIKSILDITLTQQEKDNFLTSLLSVFHILNEMEKNNKKQISPLKKNSQTNSLLTSDSESTPKKKGKYTNLKETNNLDYETDYESNHYSSCDKIEKFSKELYSSFSKFESAGDTLTSLKSFGKNNKIRGSIFINNFFTNMFVWGCIKTDDEDFTGQIMCHKEIPRRFNELIDNLENLLKLSEVQQHKHLEIYKNTNIILESIIKLNSNFSSLLFKLTSSSGLSSPNNNINPTNIFSEHGSETLNAYSSDLIDKLELTGDLEKLNIGNLIPVSCGHNGGLNEIEMHLLKYELVKANFI